MKFLKPSLELLERASRRIKKTFDLWQEVQSTDTFKEGKETRKIRRMILCHTRQKEDRFSIERPVECRLLWRLIEEPGCRLPTAD
jgi:hypothetical protein